METMPVLWRRTDYDKEMGDCVMYIFRPHYFLDRELWFYVGGNILEMPARFDWDRKGEWERL